MHSAGGAALVFILHDRRIARNLYAKDYGEQPVPSVDLGKGLCFGLRPPAPACLRALSRPFAVFFSTDRGPIVPRYLPHCPAEHLRLAWAFDISVQCGISHLCLSEQSIETSAERVVARYFALLRNAIELFVERLGRFQPDWPPTVIGVLVYTSSFSWGDPRQKPLHFVSFPSSFSSSSIVGKLPFKFTGRDSATRYSDMPNKRRGISERILRHYLILGLADDQPDTGLVVRVP